MREQETSLRLEAMCLEDRDSDALQTGEKTVTAFAEAFDDNQQPTTRQTTFIEGEGD